MDTQLEEIKKIIIDQVRENRVVTGGHLGTFIKQSFPHLNIKNVYGGLKNFIEDNCREVKWIRKQGGDDIYTSASTLNVGSKENLHYDGLIDTVSKHSFWQAFSNPGNKFCLILNKKSGELLLKQECSDLEEPYIKIEKVSREEYRKIAVGFVSTIEESLREEFGKVLVIDDFWVHWSTLINSHKKEGIFNDWVKWRTQKVVDIYENRLVEANLSPTVIENAKLNLRKGSSPHPLINREKTVNKLDIEEQETSLKGIIHAVIDKLSDNDLRRIWLPTGFLIEELNEHKTGKKN